MTSTPSPITWIIDARNMPRAKARCEAKRLMRIGLAFKPSISYVFAPLYYDPVSKAPYDRHEAKLAKARERFYKTVAGLRQNGHAVR